MLKTSTIVVVAITALLVAFVMVPADRVDPFIEFTTLEGPSGGFFTINQAVSGTKKTGLRIAIEGRLKWLGLLRSND